MYKRDVIDAQCETQFMLDDMFIDNSECIEFETNPPKKGEIVLSPDEEWERYRILPCSVLEDSGVYHMWYQAIGKYEGVRGQVDCPRCSLSNEGMKIVCKGCGWPLGEGDELLKGLVNICHAVSADGIHWVRENTGIVDYKGSTKNNITARMVGAVANNPLGPENEKYMLIAEEMRNIWIFTSPDGNRWVKKPDYVLPFSADTNNQILYDKKLGKYVAFLRGFPGRRTTVRCEFDSLEQAPWPYNDHGHKSMDNTGMIYITDELETVLDRDELDPDLPGLDINSINACIYADGVYLGFPEFFRKYPPSGLDKKGREDHRYFSQGNDGTFEVQLAVSRDGHKWYRHDRRPYLTAGIFGEPDGGLVILAPGVISRGDEVYQYYGGKRTTHGIFEPGLDEKEASIYRTIQIKDRFISISSLGHSGGWFITPPIVHSGRTLELNIDCGGLGETSVQISDDSGNPIDGFTYTDCDRVDLNHIRHTVTWRGRSDVSSLAGRPIRLEFKMLRSKLYTFRFSN